MNMFVAYSEQEVGSSVSDGSLNRVCAMLQCLGEGSPHDTVAAQHCSKCQHTQPKTPLQQTFIS